MSKKSELRVALAACFLLFVCFALLAYCSEGSYQGGDTYQHFLIAKYAWKHPHLLLDHWGKPLFTLLYSLPAQFGYGVAKVFTCFIGVVGAFFTYRCAQLLSQPSAFVAAVLVLFAPMFFIHMNSVMTEVLFSTWLIAGVYLLLREKWVPAALLLSFLPFIRTEGFVMVPFLSIWWLMHKQWKAFLLLGVGTVVYSIIGLLFHHHDVLWIFHQNPYAAVSPYGKGHWNHFVTSNKVIWGVPLFICMGCGLAYYLGSRAFSSKMDQAWKPLLWLVIVPFFVFLIFHCAAWATGTLASNGETRVMVCTMPLAALIAHFSIGKITELLPQTIWRYAHTLLISCLVIITPFQFFKMPLTPDAAQAAVMDAAKYVQQNYSGRKVHFVDPLVPLLLDIDMYEGSRGQQWFVDKEHPENGMANGDIVVWDAHFAAHEGGVPIDALHSSPHFKQVHVFPPDTTTRYVAGPSKAVIFECIK